MAKKDPMQSPGETSLDHIAEPHNLYPGETVTLNTRISVAEDSSGAMLLVTLPDGVELLSSKKSGGAPNETSMVEVLDGQCVVVWKLAGLSIERPVEFQTVLKVSPTSKDAMLISQGRLLDKDDIPLAFEYATFNIRASGQYLNFLPELYSRDEVMTRFLMLFESFWSPIEKQVAGVHNIFDPALTPAPLVPWLASWLGMDLDENLDESQRRTLTSSAVSLNRRRGTKGSLEEYLRIFTGGEVKITEFCSNDFVIGPGAELGPGIALGKGNRPHMFAVELKLPPVAASAADKRRKEEERRRDIMAVIDRQKPAHTQYTLQIFDGFKPEER